MPNVVSKNNPYLPQMGTIREIIQETPNIKTFRIVLDDPEQMAAFRFEPGQVGQLSVFGVGESTFVINSPPTRREYLQFSVMKTGEVTRALHRLCEGDPIGVRAPLGNSFPVEALKGKDILFVGGGIGMAPLRTLLLTMVDRREEFGDITVIYGARSPQDLCYRYEFDQWRAAGVNLVLTVDREFPGWEERVGFVPTVLAEEAPSPYNRVAITCGPPIMIKFVLAGLKELGYEDDQILTTLERRMKCGIGLCGRCNIGDTYVCVDGPVFSNTQLRQMVSEL
ncbi:NAD(P)H-flavin reductase [Desulfacinum hydrothermale DSM 13146]|uniref:NAD(P)H-flavin reductase n=1 Tax=Desulfacinum hydrothermale DSM 13146 TaxID=1121390 RepID=A0A1W1X0M5_9BACT|nr:FAD/NAD(P)-binding protein [Desulfacinum hydrothermale]SMC17320.1 NAD(P)H-flavin reductase [Desulfacinum hydrothermale DSM 13146]